jgi:hypothetical protein
LKESLSVPDKKPNPDRKKRPMAERTEPHRDMSSMFGAQKEAGANGAQPGETAPDPHVASGVGAGYRVIDEYLRQGQEAARAAWMGGGFPGLGGLGGVGGRGEAELAAMASQMLRYSTELASFWTAMFNNVSRPSPLGDIPRPPMPGGFDFGGPIPSPEPPASSTTPAMPPASPAPLPDATALTLAIDSKRPVEVSARLDPHCPLGKLRVHDLRAADEKLPRLQGARAERRGAGLWIALKVGKDQPAGVYSGVIVDDETNLPAGTLSVRVR